jgi:hypothetical protein
MLKVIDGAAESNQDGVAGGVSRLPIDEIAREGARQMLEAAIRRDTRAGVVADRDARRDYMTEGLNEALDLLERTAQSLRRT